MKIIRGLGNYTDNTGGCVATIGNFDGVHLGHQAVLAQLKALADHYQLPSTVISFDPLPQEYFQPPTRDQRLQQIRDRAQSICHQGMDQLLLIPFNHAFSRIDAAHFVQHTLLDTLKVRHLLIGDDFHFGAGRRGNLALIQQYCTPGAFDVGAAETFTHEGERVSSTRIRQHLRHHELQQARALLGRDYSISGLVVHGQKIGTTLGFPTANILLKSYRPILRGVFAVTATDHQGFNANGVANLGERPTVDGRKLLLEVHFPGVKEDLYGRHLEVSFCHHIRQEQKFDSLDALKSAIGDDIKKASAFFESPQPV